MAKEYDKTQSNKIKINDMQLKPITRINKELFKENSLTEIERVISENNLRFKQIQKIFMKRKKELLAYTNPSLEYVEYQLIMNNISYIKEKTFFDAQGNLFYADFFIPYYKCCIEIDGGYHNTDKRAYLDAVKESYLQRRGIITIRFANEDVFDHLFTEKFIKNLANETWINVLSNQDLAHALSLRQEYYVWQHLMTFESKKIACYNVLREHLDKMPDHIKINIMNPVIEYDRDGVVQGVYENIFYTHFRTGTKFKEILKRFKNETGKIKILYKHATLSECLSFLMDDKAKESFSYHANTFFDWSITKLRIKEDLKKTITSNYHASSVS